MMPADSRLLPEYQVASWNTRHAGKETALSIDTKGYRKVSLLGSTYRAHRILWAMAHNAWPADELDHIDGDRANNSISNLREANRIMQMQNLATQARSESGLRGVARYGRKWRAVIQTDGLKYHLGVYDTVQEAVAARTAADRILGFITRPRVTALKKKPVAAASAQEQR